VALFCVLGFALRLKGLHNPLLDHPGWRQGDTAASARNFALLRYNIFFPQTEYNGAPPNYVELELQIIPFLAATLYKMFGVHEVFGRLIAIGFGVATIPVVGFFGRWLFGSALAGIAAMALYAIFPGAIYYSRTFQPDVAMVFFLTAAVYAWSRWIVDEDARSWTGAAAACGLLALAFLAKQVALIALIPVVALGLTRFGVRGMLGRPLLLGALVASVVPLALYQPYVASHAEWHWASGIMRLHVLPSLGHAVTSVHGFIHQAAGFWRAERMLATTVLGPVGLVLFYAGFIPAPRSKADPVLWGWLGAGFAYMFVVLPVEPVDYYLAPLMPLAALTGAAAVLRLAALAGPAPSRRPVVAAGAAAAWLITLFINSTLIAPYYAWRHDVYTRTLALDRALPPDALIVMGHYDPSIMYYIRRKGWMEDPYLWTPFDEESAIRKGSRYFIAVEPKRLAKNVELSHWLERFPVLDPQAKWPVYITDPARELPGAEERWQEFRQRERTHTLN
jgi:hypothetical protein